MTISVSFSIKPAIDARGIMARDASRLPVSVTAIFGMDMLENTLKNEVVGGG